MSIAAAGHSGDELFKGSLQQADLCAIRVGARPGGAPIWRHQFPPVLFASAIVRGSPAPGGVLALRTEHIERGRDG